MMAWDRRYQWIVDRARGGEPVPIDTSRRDIGRVWDFLMAIDGRGLSMQLDNAAGLIWVVKTEGE